MTSFYKKSGTAKSIVSIVLICTLLPGGFAWGAQIAVPLPTQLPLNQIPVPESPNLFQFVKNKPAAIKLGKALFWDMQAGSDGIQACGSCHFSAGADNRRKNTVNPGTNVNIPDTTFQVRGPNETLVDSDWPFHQRQNPDFQSSPVLRDVNDVVGSQGVRLTPFGGITPGSAIDKVGATPLSDAIFKITDPATNLPVNVRQVTGRNTPSNINAIFNFSNFWDGRAYFAFNGSSPFGPLDPNAGVWFYVNGALTKQPVTIHFASLASQATGPPLSDVEMSFKGRTFPELGRKMLDPALVPLGKQFVHPNDSMLGPTSGAVLLPGGKLGGNKGLTSKYSQMIKDAFQDNLWSPPAGIAAQTVNLPTIAVPTGEPFSQMEANFSLFWGLAIQLYEATLVSDNTPYDRFLGGDVTALTDAQQRGFNIFFGEGRCNACHTGSELSNASVTAAAFVTIATNALIEQMPVANGQQIIYDAGFNNTSVTRTTDDIGRGANAPFTNPLTLSPFPLSFSQQAELQAGNSLPFVTSPLPATLPANFPVANNGSFKVPGLRNVELTAPYFHNGGMRTLNEVVDFYTRGGNFPGPNAASLDIAILEIPKLQVTPTLTNDPQGDLVAFLMSLTDERVRLQSAPFDHPEILIPEGDPEILTRKPAKDANGVEALPSNFTIGSLVSPTNKLSQLISGTMDAGSTVQLQVNNGPPIAANMPTTTTWSATVTLAAGNNTITVTSVDPANIQTTLTRTVSVDIIPPALTVNAVTTPTTGASLTLSGTVEAGITPVVTADTSATAGTPTVNGTAWSCRLTGLTAGVNNITVTATDPAGNVTSTQVALNVVIPDGNLKGTGSVDVTDALRALRIAVGVLQPTSSDMQHGDVAPLGAPDNRIDMNDAVLILRKAVGLINF